MLPRPRIAYAVHNCSKFAITVCRKDGASLAVEAADLGLAGRALVAAGDLGDQLPPVAVDRDDDQPDAPRDAGDGHRACRLPAGEPCVGDEREAERQECHEDREFLRQAGDAEQQRRPEHLLAAAFLVVLVEMDEDREAADRPEQRDRLEDDQRALVVGERIDHVGEHDQHGGGATGHLADEHAEHEGRERGDDGDELPNAEDGGEDLEMPAEDPHPPGLDEEEARWVEEERRAGRVGHPAAGDGLPDLRVEGFVDEQVVAARQPPQVQAQRGEGSTPQGRSAIARSASATSGAARCAAVAGACSSVGAAPGRCSSRYAGADSFSGTRRAAGSGRRAGRPGGRPGRGRSTGAGRGLGRRTGGTGTLRSSTASIALVPGRSSSVVIGAAPSRSRRPPPSEATPGSDRSRRSRRSCARPRRRARSAGRADGTTSAGRDARGCRRLRGSSSCSAPCSSLPCRSSRHARGTAPIPMSLPSSTQSARRRWSGRWARGR